MTTIRRLSLAILLALFGLACGGGKDAPTATEPQKEPEKEEEEEEEKKPPAHGAMKLLLQGLPAEVPAAVRVTGPDDAEFVVDASKELEELEVGTYRVEATALLDETTRYTPTPESTEVEVKEGATTLVKVTYAAAKRVLFKLEAAVGEVPLFGATDIVVDVERPEGWEGAISLRVVGLPEGYAANEATVADGASSARLSLRSVGTPGNLSPFSLRVVGEGGGQKKEVELASRGTLVVFEKEDGLPGSLRSLVEALPEIEIAGQATIHFDEGVFSEPTSLVLESSLVFEKDAVLQGIAGDTLHIVVEGRNWEDDDFFTLLKVPEDVSVEIRDLGLRHGKAKNGGLVVNGGEMTLRRVHLSDGHATERGGCIYNIGHLLMEASTVQGCQARTQGGGLYNQNSARVFSSHFKGNHAGTIGGGGINSETGLVLLASTVEGNTSDSAGGGLILGGEDWVVNSTIVGNTAGGSGGAMIARYHADVAIVHSTIADNLAEGKGGGIFAQEAEVEMAATIVWRNWVKGMPSDFFLDGGTFITRGYNMFGEDDGTLGTIGGTDSEYVDPHVLTLEDNGGPTPTMAIRDWSVAVDAIPLDECIEVFIDADFQNVLAVDQRGLPRPAGEGCDIGAFEVQ